MKGFRQQPQIVQQQQGPTMQEIEASMDQMMCQALEQVRVMYEARITTLEGLVEQQQVQLQQLQQISVLDSRVVQLADELSALHLDHSVLKDDSQACCECLLGSGILSAPQVHSRRRTCQSISAFCSLMESRERRQAMEGLLGGQAVEIKQLYLVSRAFVNARKVANEKTQPPRTIDDIDDKAFKELKDYEPPRAELDKWEKSVTVHTVIGSLKVEGLIGKTDVLKYSDVHKLFAQLGLTLDQFVDKFTKVRRDRSAEDLQEMTNTVLKRFSPQRTERKDVMSCRDLYRLLEVIGYPLQRFKAIINGSDDPEQAQAQKLGGYKIRSQISQGRNSVCYLGEHVSDQTRVAIKWPAPRDELATLKDIQRAAPKGCLGFPKVLAHGDAQREPFFVTELLGSPLSKVFQFLDNGPAERKWPILSTIGRLVVRRLEALHACGFVHCDISPENIVIGRASEKTDGSPLYALYFVDFEHAQRYPGGRAIGIDCGSVEWSSIRSGDGGERLPEDDLEALGWVLMNGLFGDLPWFPWLSAAYKDWDSQWTRHQVVKQVQSAKADFLSKGWKSFSCRKSVKMPKELASFIPACRPENAVPGKPDYKSLIEVLGGSVNKGSEEADSEDLNQFTEQLFAL